MQRPSRELAVGDVAPDFDLPDESGERLSLAGLRGNAVILFFYPEDDTPGCTTEACGFRDDHVAFLKANAVVLGVSPDDADSHEAFRRKYALPFPLLVDRDHRVAEAYGAWGEKLVQGRTWTGVLRSTFVIDPAGRMAAVFRQVRPEGHSREVLDAVEALG